MPIKFQCTHCSAKYTVDDRLAGKQARCKKCEQALQIPQAASTPATAPARVAAEPIEKATPVTVLTKAVLAEPQAQRVAAMQPDTRPIAVQATPVTPVEQVDQATLLAAISGSIQRVPTTLGYRIAATAVACLMILLPLIYIGIILATIYGVYWYAISGTELFHMDTGPRGRGGMLLVLLYVGPLIIGLVTVLFMIKPLFARPARSDGKRSLQRAQEPKLFAFVDKLCESVHAPKPKRIDVDCDVNASASFRRGMLSMLSNGDLVLTIGMPLAAGLSAQQLSGVLAHEFGHFSQGFGMRVSYVVRTISHWFARVVYERDRWDEWLANTANSLDIRFGIVLHLARLIVWLTRRILWALMMIGHIFSCNLLRQMEYDADLHEIRFSGSDTFRKTFVQLRRLGVAYQQGLVDQQTFFMDGKLGDNLPKLTYLNRDAQGDELVKELFKGVMDEKTQWMATHPADKDRIARAKHENVPGVFQLDAPASALFNNFDQTCAEVTRDMFQEIFGDELKPNMLVPVEHLVSHKAAAKEADLALKRMLGNYFRVPRQMKFSLNQDRPIDESSAMQSLTSVRTRMIDLLPAYSLLSKEFDEVDSNWLLCHQVEALLGLGAKLDQKNFAVPVSSIIDVQAAAVEHRQRLAKLHDELQPLEKSFEKRVAAAAKLLHSPTIKHSLGEAESTELALRMKAVVLTLVPVQAAYREIAEIRNRMAAVGLALQMIGGKNIDEKTSQNLMGQLNILGSDVRSVAKQFDSVQFPFEHADGAITMTQYMVPKLPEQEDIGAILMATEKLLESYFYVYFRSIGTLASITQRVEEVLGLPPQADPTPVTVLQSFNAQPE